MVMLKQRGVDCVCRYTSHRKAPDFRRGQRLAKGDHIVNWPKPPKPRSIDTNTYKTLPDFLTVRECRIHVEQPGFRSKTIIIATTLLDTEISKEDLGDLYRARWNAELDLRSLKITMQMDLLRCKTPALVRKEIWTHILAYNLIRTIMAQAAIKHEVAPRSISFKGTIQTLEAFQPIVAVLGQHSTPVRQNFYEHLLSAIAVHRVADRPDRIEPRKLKRRNKHYEWLKRHRRDEKRDIINGVSKN